MTRNNEKLLIAALAGIIITGAAVFAIQPAIASMSGPANVSSPFTGPSYEVLTLRLGYKV
ncbi:MAG: hypothetical protein EOP22_01755 [Hyphomicrobiales bacterium]|nr:MAG: hypothetical protein EOP22_01755 [Hyphomicrobiales bacterium]